MSFDPIGFIFPKSGGSGGGSGGGLPVVDIQKHIFSITAGEPVMLTEEETAQLTALTADDKVIVVNFWDDTDSAMPIPVPILCRLMFSDGQGTTMYVGLLNVTPIGIGLESGIGMVTKMG